MKNLMLLNSVPQLFREFCVTGSRSRRLKVKSWFSNNTSRVTLAAMLKRFYLLHLYFAQNSQMFILEIFPLQSRFPPLQFTIPF